VPTLTLQSAVAGLKRLYGKPAPPVSRDPFILILWEQVAYLVPDAKRRTAFLQLKARVGLQPEEILAASPATLRSIARIGGPIAAVARADRMHASAELVMRRFGGNLRQALKLPADAARRALGQFAMIGEPGADKILVFTRTARMLPLDSNGLRVLQRLGLVTEGRDYRSSYRRAREALASALPRTYDGLSDGYHLLRRHGQELCRRNAPDCPACPLRPQCPFGAVRGSGRKRKA
jgi:endonuclease III